MARPVKITLGEAQKIVLFWGIIFISILSFFLYKFLIK
jgi:hypothetical protein